MSPIGGPIIGPVGGPAPLAWPAKFKQQSWLTQVLYQFRQPQAPILNGIISGLLQGVQDVTDTDWAIATQMYPDQAVGNSVDILGAIRVVTREGRSDAAYLTAQHAWVVARRSNGLIAEIYSTLEAILPGGGFQVLDLVDDPASFVVQIQSPPQSVAPGSPDTPSVPQLHLLLEKARAAGVTLYFEWWPTDDGDTFTLGTDYGQTSTTQGLADDYSYGAPTEGGQLLGEEIA